MLRKAMQCRGMASGVIPGVSQNVSREQIAQMNDQVVLVDENDQTLDPITKADSHRLVTGTSPLHRAFSVFLFNSRNQLLIQQRSSSKITFPNYFTNSCCSHPRYNDAELNEQLYQGVKVAAQRRLNYELGIPKEQVPLSQMHHVTRIKYFARADKHWAEHELDHVILCRTDVDLSNVNADEVQHTAYFDRQQMREFVADTKLITPWFKYIYDNFLFTWWDGLDNVKDLADDKIHNAGDQTNIIPK